MEVYIWLNLLICYDFNKLIINDIYTSLSIL